MWFLESPIPALALGSVVFAGLAVGLLQTGNRKFLYGLVMIALLTVGGILIERTVVTPREEVGSMLNALAADLESNDANAVVQHVSSTSKSLRDEAVRLLGEIVVDSAVVKRNLEVDVHQTAAEARFNGVIVATDKSGVVRRQLYPRFFVLKLRKEDGQWRVSQYEHHPPHKRVPKSGTTSL